VQLEAAFPTEQPAKNGVERERIRKHDSRSTVHYGARVLGIEKKELEQYREEMKKNGRASGGSPNKHDAPLNIESALKTSTCVEPVRPEP